MRKSVLVIAVTALLVSAAATAMAGPVSGPTTFLAPLSAAQETHQVIPAAPNGMAEFTLDGSTLHYRVTVRNMTANPFAAHIHAPGARGENAGVFVTLCGGPANPGGVTPACAPTTDGELVEGTIMPSTFGDMPEKFDTLLEHIRSGNAYVNAHTANNGAGEARGQILVTGG